MSRLLLRRASLAPHVANSTALPVGDLPGWTQIVADDFDYNYPIGSVVADGSGELTTGSAAYNELHSKFTFYPDTWNSTWGGKTGTDTSGNPVTIQAKYYPSKTIYFEESCAKIYHHSENIGGVMTALGASIKPKNPSGVYNFGPYMRWQFRMRATGVTASPSYFHWVPLGIDSNNWPSNGELDWPEGDISSAVAGNYHPAASTNITQHVSSGEDPSAWNIYTVEWTPGRMKWWTNSALRLNTTDRVPTGPLSFVFQHETTNVQPDSATTGTIEIDWIAMWNYTP
jgi:hypothetical protein